VEALPESIWVQWNFLSSSSVECGRINRVLWDMVFQLLLDPSKVNCFDQVEDPR
jgi:hypothetical protein